LYLRGRKWQEAEEDCEMRSCMVIKSKRMRWVGHKPCIGEMRNAYKILVGKAEGKNYSGDLGIDMKVKLEWILVKLDGKLQTGLT
jgi:hypothetical protein